MSRLQRARRRQSKERDAGLEPLFSVDEVALQAEQTAGQTDVFEQLDEPLPYPSRPCHTGKHQQPPPRRSSK